MRRVWNIYEEPEYIVYDTYNYIARPERCYKKEDEFKEVLYQLQGKEGKETSSNTLELIKAEISNIQKKK